MKKAGWIILLFLLLTIDLRLIMSPRIIKGHDGDESCPPTHPISRCDVLNPDPTICLDHQACTGGITSHFCCASTTTPTPTPRFFRCNVNGTCTRAEARDGGQYTGLTECSRACWPSSTNCPVDRPVEYCSNPRGTNCMLMSTLCVGAQLRYCCQLTTSPIPTPGGGGNCFGGQGFCSQDTIGICDQYPGYNNVPAGRPDCPPDDPNGLYIYNCCLPPTIPTPPPVSVDCSQACSDPNYPIARCADWQSANRFLCSRPPAPNDLLDCQIGGQTLDCFCCAPTPTPFPTINPLCPDGESINTAIGCIPIRNTTLFAGWVLRWTFGVGGGIAFLLIVYSGFMITTSAGNPQRIQAGKELLTAAIAGIMLMIFAVFIMEIIGVRILQIPGF